MIRLAYLFITTLFVFQTFANEIFVYKKKPAFIKQTEEFLVAEGESVLGPIKLYPLGITDNLLIKPALNNIQVKSILIEQISRNWKKNLIGKNISLEGGGRFIRGKVKSIEKNTVVIDTSRGTVITTLPDFPEKLTSVLKWDELFSPYILIKIDSKTSGNAKFDIMYHLNGLSWDTRYIYNVDKNKLQAFIRIVNKTNITFHKVGLNIVYKGKVIFNKELTVEENSEKLVSIGTFNVKDYKVDTKQVLPDGTVSIYKNGLFVGSKMLKNYILR